MKRRVIIITNPGKDNAENYCKGVYKDASNYESFFMSPYGGYYSSNEIRVLDKPSRFRVFRELSLLTMENVEFSIIIFCGHAYYSTISESNILQINDSEEIDSLDLRNNAKKRIIIEDNCREPHAEYILESYTKMFSVKDSTGKQLNPQLCKEFYNEQIENCPNQLIIGMACDIGETAGDNETSGGFYSSSLLKATKKLVETNLRYIALERSFQVFSFPECHDAAVPLVKKLSGNLQNPTIIKPRLNETKLLPFAVIA